MKKILSILLTICLLSSMMIGCGYGNADGDYKIYYINTDKSGITGVNYDFTAEDTDGMITEAIDMLGADPDDIDYVTTIPSKVEIKRWELTGDDLVLYFVGEYDSMDIFTEILVRAAIVKTLVQIDGVESVSFNINNTPLTDSTGEAVGSMSGDTFIDDFGQETDSLLSTTLTLYFASADGMSLVAEDRQVYYSRSVSEEKLIIEQLLKGPDSEGLLSTLPTGTKLNSISISEDGVCIVNFDAAFETAITGVTENVTVYSVVDSLTEMNSIKQVQILVNGETPHISNVDMDLSGAVSRNEDIINIVSDEEEGIYYPQEDDYLAEDYSADDYVTQDSPSDNGTED